MREPSPHYRAERSDRYQRKELIAALEKELDGGSVLVYFSLQGYISRPDVGCFVEALEWFNRKGRDLLIILETPGGDPQVVRLWVELSRKRFERLIVAVPGRAKSAGTLLCLAADEVWAGPGSEFGPIDPQLPVMMMGTRMPVSAVQFLQELGMLEPHPELTSIQADPELASIRLQQVPPGFASQVMQALRATHDLAIEFLYQHHFGGLSSGVERARKSLELANFLTMLERSSTRGQGQLYLHSDYLSPAVLRRRGMKVKVHPFTDRIWRLIYQLYAQYEVAARDTPGCVIFESYDVLCTRPS